MSFSCKIAKKKEMEKFLFCVIMFEPIQIQTHLAPQNDRLNLSFVKDIHKWSYNGHLAFANFGKHPLPIPKLQCMLCVKKL